MNLKQEYGQKLRVTIDESFQGSTTEDRKEDWRFHEIKGRHGMVFMYGQDIPAVTFNSIIVANRFNNRGWKTVQNGEIERTVLIPKDALNQVLEAIQPRKRRQVSEAQRLIAAERLRKWAFKTKSNA
jgi:hypothetical protein